MVIKKNKLKKELKLKILHVSHTNILSDSRILKEMNALSNSSFNFKLYGIGIGDSEYINNDNYNANNKLNILNHNLTFKKLKYMPFFLKIS